MSMLSIPLYGCVTWALLADSETRDPGFRDQVPEETSPHFLLGARDQRLGAEQDQLPCGSTGTSSGNCQEMKTSMIREFHTAQQPLQNHPSWHLGGLATPWSAEELLDGKHQRVDIPAHARNCSQGPPAEKTGRGSLLNRPSRSPDDPVGQGTELN